MTTFNPLKITDLRKDENRVLAFISKAENGDTFATVSKGDVIIGNDVWIGADAVILSGVKIGDGAVIGNSAVITKDVPPYHIVVGNPARIVRARFSEEEIKMLQELKWWNWADDKLDSAMKYLLSNNINGLYKFSSEYNE